MRIKSGAYTGVTGAHNITGIGFDPIVVMVKGAAATALNVRTSSMGGGTSAKQYTGTGFSTNILTALVTDGFSVSTSSASNTNGADYDYLALGDDGSADIACWTYTGTGVAHAETVPTLSSYDYLLIMSEAGQIPVSATSTMAGNNAHAGSGSLVTTLISARTATTFTLTTSAVVNTNGTIHHCIALKNVANFFKVFTFTGDGSNDRNLNASLGFTPTTASIKSAASNQPIWKFFNQDGVDFSSPSNAAVEAADMIQLFLSDGVQLGTSATVNASPVVMHGFAFKNVVSSAAAGTAVRHRARPRFF